VQLRQLAGVDRVGVLGPWIPARAHILGKGRDARIHLLLEVGVALDKARPKSVANPQQVVEKA